MPVETDPSTTTSGGGTTVGATVRETGPGGTAHTLDVFLHVQSSKFTHAGAPLGAFQVDTDRLSVWWKDQALPAGGQFNVAYRITRKPGNAYEGPAEATITVCDRSALSPVFLVKRFTVT
jgi:hypothetical protein